MIFERVIMSSEERLSGLRERVAAPFTHPIGSVPGPKTKLRGRRFNFGVSFRPGYSGSSWEGGGPKLGRGWADCLSIVKTLFNKNGRVGPFGGPKHTISGVGCTAPLAPLDLLVYE